MTATTTDFAAAFRAIIGQHRYRRARIGLSVHRLADGAVRFEHEPQIYFEGASTTKIPTVASALAALGPDFRFRTVVRHTGTLAPDGTLHGDLVIVASGDPNLSARVRPDDTLAFADVDHALGAIPGVAVVPGDPLLVMRALATAVAERGVRRITGRVCIDLSIFPEGFRESGTDVVLSPIVVNDNLVDLTARAGNAPGEPVTIAASPATSYVSFVSEAVTGSAESTPALTLSSEERQEDGTRIVRVGGSLPAGVTQLDTHPVDSPSAFARTIFIELLAGLNVKVETGTAGSSVYTGGPDALAPAVLAEHVSPPFSEAAKIILKVSQNLHAELCTRVVGAERGVRGAGAEDAGFAQLRAFLAALGLDGDDEGIVQGDSCGARGYFTPDFMCRLLRAIATHPIAPAIRAALPILGRDGSLFSIVPESPAAGHVFAKTGTHGFPDRLRPRTMVLAKGLAGYIETASGETLVFAAYANQVALEPGETYGTAGTLLGEIAAAAYALL
jgi:D-alanyl-D-alanine carboxypeptidase/D-alanyl-D-alanine-endopeptidase (penicillin-binding protein 4)